MNKNVNITSSWNSEPKKTHDYTYLGISLFFFLLCNQDLTMENLTACVSSQQETINKINQQLSLLQ